VQIVDNNPEATSNPIDISRTFAGQHYHDFLYRQSDASGEDFWTNNIESCGAERAMPASQAVDTSTAFFLSIEFKETGFLSYGPRRPPLAMIRLCRDTTYSSAISARSGKVWSWARAIGKVNWRRTNRII
jgi:hypothetical protein